jgi:hypothetical protein
LGVFLDPQMAYEISTKTYGGFFDLPQGVAMIFQSQMCQSHNVTRRRSPNCVAF